MKHPIIYSCIVDDGGTGGSKIVRMGTSPELHDASPTEIFNKKAPPLEGRVAAGYLDLSCMFISCASGEDAPEKGSGLKFLEYIDHNGTPIGVNSKPSILIPWLLSEVNYIHGVDD